MLSRTASSIISAALQPIAPRVIRSLDVWAEAERIINYGARQGSWSHGFFPPALEIMQRASQSSVKSLVICGATQLMKTELIINTSLWQIIENRKPIIIAMPTLDLAERFAKSRLDREIRGNKKVAAEIAIDNTRLKVYAGGFLHVTSSGEKDALSSDSAEIVILDEAAKHNSGAFGDAQARVATYDRGRVIITGHPLPSEPGHTAFMNAYNAGSQGEYFGTCPACDADVRMDWSSVHYPRDQEGTPVLDKKQIAVFCTACGTMHNEKTRKAMLEGGRFIHRHPELSNTTPSYHVPATLSHRRDLLEIVTEYRKAHIALANGSQAEMTQFYSNTLAQEYLIDLGHLTNVASNLQRFVALPDGIVPNDYPLIILTADVQNNYIEYEIRAHQYLPDHDGEDADPNQVGLLGLRPSIGLDHGRIKGGTNDDAVWAKFRKIYHRIYHTASGLAVGISLVGIDRGGPHGMAHTVRIDRMEQEWRDAATSPQRNFQSGTYLRQIVPIHGRAKDSKNRADYKQNPKTGSRYMLINTNEIKDLLNGEMQRTSEPAFRWRVGMKGRKVYDAAYFASFESEEPVEKVLYDGTMKRHWQKRSGVKHNEAWDLAVYQTALAEMFATPAEMSNYQSMVESKILFSSGIEATLWELADAKV